MLVLYFVYFPLPESEVILVPTILAYTTYVLCDTRAYLQNLSGDEIIHGPTIDTKATKPKQIWPKIDIHPALCGSALLPSPYTPRHFSLKKCMYFRVGGSCRASQPASQLAISALLGWEKEHAIQPTSTDPTEISLSLLLGRQLHSSGVLPTVDIFHIWALYC